MRHTGLLNSRWRYKKRQDREEGVGAEKLVSISCQEVLLSRAREEEKRCAACCMCVHEVPSCPGGSYLKPQAVVVIQQDVGSAGSEDERGVVAARDRTLEASDERMWFLVSHTLCLHERGIQSPSKLS